ncbi:hypothetical protein NEOC84_000461|nr:Uncharacterized protein [Neochlamydia sp. AcF95]NGY94578.1 hypothetical protein [Neochlamydia sp. AcF84]
MLNNSPCFPLDENLSPLNVGFYLDAKHFNRLQSYPSKKLNHSYSKYLIKCSN